MMEPKFKHICCPASKNDYMTNQPKDDGQLTLDPGLHFKFSDTCGVQVVG